MRLAAIHEPALIKEYLNRPDRGNLIYYCNNLEPPFWENTQWFGLMAGEHLAALAMLITKYQVPALLATSYRPDDPYLPELLERLRPYLPQDLYCHVDSHAVERLPSGMAGQRVSPYYNMKLVDRNRLPVLDPGRAVRLGTADKPAIIALLEESHPDYLLDEEFCDAGYYWGIREAGRLVSLAGVVAKSEEYAIAAVGCVTTHPDFRRAGLATQVMAALIHDLTPRYGEIVLNVKQANQNAVRCYRKLGFEVIGEFAEVCGSDCRF
ncbi:FR47-like protein [Hydrogenispora ethanolica]|jgi:GNAT superfamily N-acetyltransferase|uniref:FR47-like protein n=1 Tax=Hydrogenispora ethanolica TaxID=1082276 RepID=A0A4R1RMA6_HYDET|nr:GNAT family N-acetyltransferase [Hydrogenispora ethanolica]TCL67324.1 FR47-like protein [Hydrogenispora ethanolica]